MSVKVMARVWDKSKQKNGQLLLLLAIADRADEEGVAFPGVKYLADKVRLTPRQTKRLLHNLGTTNELYVLSQRGMKGGRGYTNLYFITTGLEQNQIEAILTNRFEYPADEAHQIAVQILEKGDTCATHKVSKKDDIDDTQKTEKGDIQGQKGDIQGTKRVTSMSPDPSCIHHESVLSQSDNRLSNSGKADSHSLTSLPGAEKQAGVLFAGKTNGSQAGLDESESLLQRSGWNIRQKHIKDAIVYCLSVTHWSIPPPGRRKLWERDVRYQVDELGFSLAELLDSYASAYARLLNSTGRDGQPLTIPPHPGALTKTMEAIREEHKREKLTPQLEWEWRT